MPGPLAGVRIVDATTVVLGPLATQMLGDLGADVVKIEPPEGDSTRKLGPTRNPDMAAFYLACNRNKRSVVLDLKQTAGHGALMRLIERADVFVHNFRPQAAARLQVEYERVRALNPGLIYCATYGFRAAGPYGNKPVYDDIIQAASGLASLQAPLVGDPRYLPTIVADKTSSMAVAHALLAALYHKARTGEGQAIEVPMFETVVAWMMVEHLYGETFMPALDTAGYKRVLNKWRRPFPTKDGYLAIIPYTDVHWQTFFHVAGREDLLADPRFGTLASRLTHIELLYEELGKIAATRTNAEWLDLLDAANVPATVVNTLESILTDPQLEATGFWKTIAHPTEGLLRTPDIPATYSRTPGELRRHQPRLGEHSVEILKEAGLSEADIRAMLAAGATRQP